MPGLTVFWRGGVGSRRQAMIDRLVKAAGRAKKNGLYTSVMPWEATKAPIQFLERLYKAVANEAGVDQITYTDTMGYGLPWTTAFMVRKVREWAPNVTVGMHAHNDYGLATAVMLSGVTAGASTVHTAINTLGKGRQCLHRRGCSGCGAPPGSRYRHNLSKIYDVTRLVLEVTKIPIPLNKPISGDNEFTVESGMVADMNLRMMKTGKPFATLPFKPELIGRGPLNIIVGKMTGGAVIRDKLERMGVSASKEQVKEIVERVKSQAIVRKWSLPDPVFAKIVRDVTEGR